MIDMAEARKLWRAPYGLRKIRLVGRAQVESAIAMLNNAPLDADRPLLLMLGEEPKIRTLDQNAAYRAGPLRDIAMQAWFEVVDKNTGKVYKRQFSADVLHEHFKIEYLPDENTLADDEIMLRVKDPTTYRKWDITPRGASVCAGSTTQLTKYGFGEYMTQVEAFGAGLGVQFSAGPGRALV